MCILKQASDRQAINHISKGSQNILIYNFIVTTFDCQGGSQGVGISARAFALTRPGVASPLPDAAFVWRWEFRKCSSMSMEDFVAGES